MPKHDRVPLLTLLFPALLMLACGVASQVPTARPAPASSPTISSSPTPAGPTPTITFAEHPKTRWDRFPTVMIVGKPGDPRFAGVEDAVQWWNDQLQSIGTGFHFGAVSENTSLDPDLLVPDELKTSDPNDPGNPRPGIPPAAEKLQADIIVVLTSYDLTSRNMFEAQAPKIIHDVILMKDFALGGASGQAAGGGGAARHELGHAVGLAHDSSVGSIMCGPPWNDQQGCLNRASQSILEPDKAYLLSIYPAGWAPGP